MEYPNPMPRLWMFLALGVTLALAQLRHFENAAKLEIQTNLPTRIYLFKSDRPFRLHPVDAILPLKLDLFYRDTLWRKTPIRRRSKSLTTTNSTSSFLLTRRRSTYPPETIASKPIAASSSRP